MIWFLLAVVAVVLAYKFRAALLARVLGQPQSRIERHLEQRKRR